MSEDAAHLAVFISGAGHGIGRATPDKTAALCRQRRRPVPQPLH